MGRMRKRRQTGFQNMLDQYKILQTIADDYDLRMLQVERKNGVFRVNTSQGWKKVKSFKYSQADLEYVHGALEHLAGKGWKRSMPFHLTKGGLPYVGTPQGLIYMTTWVQGTEINPEDPFHLEMAAKVLGEMHRLLQDYPGMGECHRQFPPHWQEKYSRQAEDLERYRQQSEGARKGKFGRRFYQVADDFIRMTGIGLQLLYEADYDHVSQNAKSITTCHTSPIASNLIIGNDGKLYVIDFDNARRDLKVYDLGRMIVRHSGWDVDKALFIIENYQEANPLTQEEIALLPGLCAFPNRGWQVARSFYEQGKIHSRRLEAAIDELAKQEAFAKALSQIQPAKLVQSPLQLFQTIPYPEPVAAEPDVGKMEVVARPEVQVEEAIALPEVDAGTKEQVAKASMDITGDISNEVLPETEPGVKGGGLETVMTEGETLLPEEALMEPTGQKFPDFYWGDEDSVFDQLEDEQLWSLKHELASLARRMEAISDAVFGEIQGGGEWVDEGHVPQGPEHGSDDMVMLPGSEVPVQVVGGQEKDTNGLVSITLGIHQEEPIHVEVLEDQAEEIPAIEVVAEIGERLSDMGKEVEVRATVGDLGWYLKEEGEVRLDIAADMEHIHGEIPIEETVSLEVDHREVIQGEEMPVLDANQAGPEDVIFPGVEIPVEYVAGLESPEVEEVSSRDLAMGFQEPVYLAVPLWESVDSPSVRGEDIPVSAVEAMEIGEVDAKAVVEEDGIAKAEPHEDVASSATEQVVWEASEDKILTGVEEVAAPAPEIADLESTAEVGLVEEVGGEAITRDEQQKERPIAPGHRPRMGTVEWGSFPEPLGGRRRGRERRSV
jgi:CotS family spore coat protein